MLTKSETASDFIEGRINLCHSQLQYMNTYREGLHNTERLSVSERRAELEHILVNYMPFFDELRLLNKQRKTLEEDLEDAMTESEEISFELAYSNLLSARMTAMDFRSSVMRYFGAVRNYMTGGSQLGYCHLTGWWDIRFVDVSPLVPPSLEGKDISDLFGVGDLALSYARNGISLHMTLKHGLDNGTIAIAPILPQDDEKMRWKCMLVRETLRNTACFWAINRATKWGDLDERELTFLTEKRPAKRFLYFRFIITYLQAKRAGYTGFTRKVESQEGIWTILGEHMRKQTLVPLSRNLGIDVHPRLHEDTTKSESEADNAMSLAFRILDVIDENVKKDWGAEDDKNDEEEEMDVDE